MATIRRAAPDDKRELMTLARLMHEESPRFSRMSFAEGKASSVIDFLIADPSGCAFVADDGDRIVGMMGGIVVEHFFSRALTASDLVLYVLPQHRGSSVAVRLVRQFEQWAIAAGACEVVLSVGTELQAERTATLFERLGYARSGIMTIKRAA